MISSSKSSIRLVLKKLFIISFILIQTFFIQGVKADNAKTEGSIERQFSEQQIHQSFKTKFNLIESFMSAHQEQLSSNPQVISQFVKKELMNVWSADLTIRAIIGVQRWKTLVKTEREALLKAYTNTMERYLFETMSQYSDQIARVENIRLNEKQNKGWLTAVITSSKLPDLKVDLKLYKQQHEWKVYDFSFQGISFVKLKQLGYRSTFDKDGAKALVGQLNDKNQKFTEALGSAN